MIRFKFISSAAILLLLGVGCSTLQTTPAPTAYPQEYLPTVIQQTRQAGHTQVATSTSPGIPSNFPPVSPVSTLEPGSTNFITPTLNPSGQSPTASPSPDATAKIYITKTPSYRATRTPTITPTPTTPVADIQFAMPGPMSRIASPLHMIANLRSVPSGTYHVELWIEPLQAGDEPRLIYREVQRIISNPVDWVYLDQEIQFEIDRVAEYAQLRVSLYDQYDRPVSINSVDLILLQMGTSSITPAAGKTEPIVIRQPTPNQLIQGGKVVVSGIVNPSQDFMLVELVTADGLVVGYRQVIVEPSADGGYVPYAIEVPYEVNEGVWVQLRVSESNTRIAGMENLTSIQIYLSP